LGRNVTMVFALLMRLRQAVLHPSLLLKKLAQNLAESKGKPKTDDEVIAEVAEKSIQSLVEAYGGISKDEVVNLLSQTAEPSLLGCCICFEVSPPSFRVSQFTRVGADPPTYSQPMETAVFLPDCKHHACKECLIDHFSALEEKGEEPRCPVCRSGPYSDSQVDRILNSAGEVHGSQPSKGYTVTTSSPSSGGDVLTIDDSSEEDEPRAKVKTKPAGKKKARMELSSDSDSDGVVRSVAKVEARVKERTARAAALKKFELVEEEDGEEEGAQQPAKAGDESDEDFKMGDVNDSDADEAGATAARTRVKAMVLDKDFKSSTKLDALIASLEKAREEDPKLKAVVFSRELHIFRPALPLADR
jgi:DNA repair protein RAD5